MIKEKRQPMDKKEFLDKLEEYLSDELPMDEVTSNIRFYTEYISSSTKEEEARKIAEVGDPRLIAMNIVETYKMSHNDLKGAKRTQYEDGGDEMYRDGGQHTMNKGLSKLSSIKVKIIGAVSIVLFIAFIILLFKALSFMFRLLLPVLLVFFLVILFVGVFKK